MAGRRDEGQAGRSASPPCVCSVAPWDLPSASLLGSTSASSVSQGHKRRTGHGDEDPTTCSPAPLRPLLVLLSFPELFPMKPTQLFLVSSFFSKHPPVPKAGSVQQPFAPDFVNAAEQNSSKTILALCLLSDLWPHGACASLSNFLPASFHPVE